jgi:hypothetical protein
MHVRAAALHESGPGPFFRFAALQHNARNGEQTGRSAGSYAMAGRHLLGGAAKPADGEDASQRADGLATRYVCEGELSCARPYLTRRYVNCVAGPPYDGAGLRIFSSSTVMDSTSCFRSVPFQFGYELPSMRTV